MAERSFTEEDFHNQDTSKDIVIQVYFDIEIENHPNGLAVKIAGFELRCKAYKKRVGKKPAGSLKVSYVCIDSKGSVIKYPPERLKKGQQAEGYWLELRVSGDLREKVPFIYVDVLREYDRQNPGSRWSVLRKLFNEVNTEFLNDRTKIKIKQQDGSTVEMTRKEAFEAAVKEAHNFLHTEAFKEIEKKLVKNVMDQMGLHPTESSVALHFESHDPSHAYKSLQLYVDQMGITSPAAEVGAGLQSAIVVGIFRTYEEMKKEGAIFAIEEPEVFLHPQKARYFESVLQRLSESGNQVFLTTHSPIFVSIYKPEAVAIIRRTPEDGTKAIQAARIELATDERKALRLMTEFDAQRNELFFAKKVMLVEGNTEKIAVPLVFQAMQVDVNQLGVSIVECGGKTKLSLFVRVLKAFGIPYVVLADHDIRKINEEWEDKRKVKVKEQNCKHNQWNKDIEGICDSACLFWLYPNFEGALGLSHNESDKIDNALAKFVDAQQEDIPDCLRKPIEKLLTL
jgi:predicted ATP-dependent endonuclease of OLD family